jgi:hypothetical protein
VEVLSRGKNVGAALKLDLAARNFYAPPAIAWKLEYAVPSRNFRHFAARFMEQPKTTRLYRSVVGS